MTASGSDEAGIDCGGSCAACPTCSDGVKNGTETGVDCGGSCAACTPGATTVWLEAEAGARSGSPTFTVATSTAASGGSYLNATNDSPNAVGPSRVTFTVNVLAGTYALWARVIAPNASDDSLWVKMDAGAFVKWNDIAASSAWVWARVKNSDSGNALVSYTLAAGTHTIEIANRENGVFIDKLYLTANGDTPSGLGGGNETAAMRPAAAARPARPARRTAACAAPGATATSGPWRRRAA